MASTRIPTPHNDPHKKGESQSGSFMIYDGVMESEWYQCEVRQMEFFLRWTTTNLKFLSGPKDRDIGGELGFKHWLRNGRLVLGFQM
jgi:hypothetical protein